MIWKVLLTPRHRLPAVQLGLPSRMLTLALGFYQLTINVFIGLCCVEVLRAMLDKIALKDILRALAMRVLHMH